MRGLVGIVAACWVMSAAHGLEAAPEWDAETVRLFASLPIQDGGRVKPLETVAGFRLLQFNGRRKCAVGVPSLPGPLGRMIYPNRKPVAWLLDCLFYPEVAREYAMFLVENADVLVALGAGPPEKKRGRYAYAWLEPARDRLLEMAGTYADLPGKELDTVQRQLVRLAENVVAFERLVGGMAFSRSTFDVGEGEVLSGLFAGGAAVHLSEVLARAPDIHGRFLGLRDGEGDFDDETRARELDAFRALFAWLDDVRGVAGDMALFPPPPGETQWLTVSDVVTRAFDPDSDVSEQVGWIGLWEGLAGARGDETGFGGVLRQYHAGVTGRAAARGEYGAVELEVAFYRLKLVHRSLVLYIVAFVLIAVSWLMPRRRVMRVLAPAGLTVPTVVLVAGIVMRCVIRSRPPATTLYETILFVTAVVVVIALFAEYVSRQRIALAVGGALGVLGMLLANKYEVSHAQDTMPSMVAVLDTNFWLTAHVTTIVIGYAASLLSGAMAHVYIFGRAAGVRREDAGFYKGLSRMVYGIMCFGFFFTFMGTVLGGIWANESWGRFWGWDPKENGALLIVLWQLATLHARLGGYIRDLGVSVSAVFGAAIVAFSWWGVNLLGVGLHTYGFTSGTMNTLAAYWGFEALVILLGAAVWLRGRRATRVADSP